METNTNPSTEDIDALFSSIDEESTNNRENSNNETAASSEPNLNQDLDADMADILKSFQNLKDEVPGFAANDPLLENIFPSSDINLSNNESPTQNDNQEEPTPENEEIVPPPPLETLPPEEDQEDLGNNIDNIDITPPNLNEGDEQEEIVSSPIIPEEDITPLSDLDNFPTFNQTVSQDSEEFPTEEPLLEQSPPPVEEDFDLTQDVEPSYNAPSSPVSGFLDEDEDTGTTRENETLTDENIKEQETLAMLDEMAPEEELSEASLKEPFSFDDNPLDLRLEELGDDFFGNDTPSSPSPSLDKNNEVSSSTVRETTSQEEALSDMDILRNNLALLPEELSSSIKNYLENHPSSDPLAKKIRRELQIQPIDIAKIQGFLTPAKSAFSFRKALVWLLLALLVLLGGFYSFQIFTVNPEENMLKQGLSLIKNSEIDKGNNIFLNNNPSVYWYNAYTKALLDKGAYDLAKIKLLGDSKEQKGVLEIEPKNKRALINLATLLIGEEKYDLALSSSAKIDGKNAVSLGYLKEIYPKDVEIQDLIGKSYLGLARKTTNEKDKDEYMAKAYKVYSDIQNKKEKNIVALSGLLDLALLTGKNETSIAIENLIKRGLLKKLDQDTLSRVGLYYLNSNSIGEATLLFNTLKLQKSKNPNTPFTPRALHFLGNFYMQSGDLNGAESNLILASYGNTLKNSEGYVVNALDAPLEGEIDNSLARVYLNLLKQYEGRGNFNQEMYDTYKKLALFHLKKSSSYLPNDSSNYALEGDIHYRDKDYNKARDNYEKSLDLFRAQKKEIPMDLSYNYGNSLYKTGEYAKSILVLTDLRGKNPLVYPTVEYLLGMSYLQEKNYPQAVDRLSRVLDYYQTDIKNIQGKGYGQSVSDIQKLYFNAIVNNNLGVIYQKEGIRLSNPSMTAKARNYFYTALEYSKRMNVNTVLRTPEFNLQASLVENNVRISNSPNFLNQQPELYNYTPDSFLGFAS